LNTSADCAKRLRVSLAVLTVTVGMAVVLILCPPTGGSETQQLPVLLVHGFQALPRFEPPLLWEAMAELLSGNSIQNSEEIVLNDGHTFFTLPAADLSRRDVFISDYTIECGPTVDDIRYYSARVANEIAWITNALECERVDVVAHSMGGLIARAYIEADDFLSVLGEEDFPDHGLSYRGDIRMLVMLATPHRGISYATFGDWLGPAVRQMSPESAFLRLLNGKDSPDDESSHLHSGVIYVTFAGQSCLGCRVRGDEEVCLRDCVTEAKRWMGSDGVVQMDSARLAGADNHACISLEHTSMRAHPVVCAAVVAALDGRYMSEIIYTSPEFRFDETQL